jgi:hypothetical protein
MRVEHDQFYTSPEVAHECVKILSKYTYPDQIWIEPSAGTGVFLDLVPGAVGYDIDPKHSRIQQADFLAIDIPQDCIVYGNPPFGRQSSLATKFIRHAAIGAVLIGFILPLSFTKPSMQRAFPSTFHLLESWILPANAFLANGLPYHVPSVFQVWKRMDVPRQLPEPVVPQGFEYVKKEEPHHLAFRRVGGRAGQCFLPTPDQNPQCFYFVNLEDPSLATDIIEKSSTYDFPTNTTGPRSLSKSEASLFLNSCMTNTTSGH